MVGKVVVTVTQVARLLQLGLCREKVVIVKMSNKSGKSRGSASGAVNVHTFPVSDDDSSASTADVTTTDQLPPVMQEAPLPTAVVVDVNDGPSVDIAASKRNFGRGRPMNRLLKDEIKRERDPDTRIHVQVVCWNFFSEARLLDLVEKKHQGE